MYSLGCKSQKFLPAFTGTLSTIPREIKVGYVIAIPKFSRILNAEEGRKPLFTPVKLGKAKGFCFITLSVRCTYRKHIKFCWYSWKIPVHVCLPKTLLFPGNSTPLESSGRIRVRFGYSPSLSVMPRNTAGVLGNSCFLSQGIFFIWEISYK